MNAAEDFQEKLRRVEALAARIEAAPESGPRADALEFVRALMELNAEGLERLLEIIYEAGGAAAIDALARDARVEALLLLYGLHPDGVATRLDRALEKMKIFLAMNGAAAALESLDENGARVTLTVTHAASAGHLEKMLEETIFELAPDVAALEIRVAAPAKLVQIQRLK